MQFCGLIFFIYFLGDFFLQWKSVPFLELLNWQPRGQALHGEQVEQESPVACCLPDVLLCQHQLSGWVGNTQSARLCLASLPGIIISTNYDGIPHDVNSHPLGIKRRRPNSFQADQIQISGTVSVQLLSSWAALLCVASSVKQKSCSIRVCSDLQWKFNLYI